MSGEMARAKVLDLMKERSMSLAEFSARLSLTPEVIAARLGGRGALTLSELRRMAVVLDVPLDELTDGAWYGCPVCNGVGPVPTHLAGCTADRASADLLPAGPQ